jgi:hypothetical protein
MRSRRTSIKKPASRVKRSGEEYQYSYKEATTVNPDEVTSRAMNALEHLGSQRFGMSPYSEHFRRWLLDVESVVNDFRTSLPDFANEDFTTSVTQYLSSIRTELNGRIDAEEKLSAKITEAQGQLAENERKIAQLESDQRTELHELKRTSDKSMKKIRGEIDALDEERLSLIRQKPTLFERIFGGNKSRVDNSSRSIHVKRSDLETRREDLRQRTNALKLSHEEKRKPLLERQKKLRDELDNLRRGTQDDGVEVRKMTCDQLRQAISAAIAHPAAQQSQEQ